MSTMRKFKWWWLFACFFVWLIATCVYWYSYVLHPSFPNIGETAANTLISMAMSGIVVLIYHHPRTQQFRRQKLKMACYCTIILPIITNVLLCHFTAGALWEYIMTVITGIGTGGVAFLFTIYDNEIDWQETACEKEGPPIGIEKND